MVTEASQVAERPSRPPGFDMTYQPEEQSFGPPWLSRVPSFVYLLAAVVAGVLLIIGENSSSNSFLFNYVVAQDQNRVMSMRTFAIVLLVGAVSSVPRWGLRRVRILPGGGGALDVRCWIIPSVRRYTWPQLEHIVLDSTTSVALDLWDGRREFLPAVNGRQALEATLERVAAARAIPV